MSLTKFPLFSFKSSILLQTVWDLSFLPNQNRMSSAKRGVWCEFYTFGERIFEEREKKSSSSRCPQKSHPSSSMTNRRCGQWQTGQFLSTHITWHARIALKLYPTRLLSAQISKWLNGKNFVQCEEELFKNYFFLHCEENTKKSFLCCLGRNYFLMGWSKFNSRWFGACWKVSTHFILLQQVI